MALASLEICTPVNFCVLVSYMYINILLLILHVAFPSSIYTWSTLVRSFVRVSESVPWMWIAIFFIVHTYTCIFMPTWKRKEYMYRCLILKQLQSYGMFPEVMNFVLPDAAAVKLSVMSTQLYWGSLAPRKTYCNYRSSFKQF